MTTVLLDCDDVLLDWIGGFTKFAEERLQRTLHDRPNAWDMSEWLGIPNEDIGPMIQEFNTSPAFAELDPVPGAQEALMNAWEGVRYHVITSCSSDPETVAMRRANLDLHYHTDLFDSLHCLDLGESKRKLLQAWKPGAIWVEDNVKNAELGIECGHTSLLLSKPHNLHLAAHAHEDLLCFKSWDEIDLRSI